MFGAVGRPLPLQGTGTKDQPPPLASLPQKGGGTGWGSGVARNSHATIMLFPQHPDTIGLECVEGKGKDHLMDHANAGGGIVDPNITDLAALADGPGI